MLVGRALSVLSKENAATSLPEDEELCVLCGLCGKMRNISKVRIWARTFFQNNQLIAEALCISEFSL